MCSNSSFSLSEDSRSHRSLPRLLWSVASGWKTVSFFFYFYMLFTLLSLLTIVKPLRCRLMRLAGYICPTTRGSCVCSHEIPPLPPTKKVLPPFKRLQTTLEDSETAQGCAAGHLCGDRIILLVFILQIRNIRGLKEKTLKTLQSITIMGFPRKTTLLYTSDPFDRLF